MKKKTNKQQRRKIKELYDGSWDSIVDIAEQFNIDKAQIRYIVNHKGRRRKQIEASLRWRKNNRNKYNMYMRNFYKKHAHAKTN